MKKLLQEVRAPGPNPNLCLQTPLVPTPNSRIANSSLINPWRAQSEEFPQLSKHNAAPLVTALRESCLLTTCWLKSTSLWRRFGRPASRHGNLIFFSDSLTSTFLVLLLKLLSAASQRRPMPPLPLPRPRGRPSKSLRAVAPVDPSKSSQPPRHPHESVVPTPPVVLPPPNPSPLPAPTATCRPIHARPEQRPHSKRAALSLEVLEGLRHLRATRLLHPGYSLRGALANPQEESPQTRNHPRYPLPGATANPPGESPRTWHLVPPRKVDVRLHEKVNSSFHGARPVY